MRNILVYRGLPPPPPDYVAMYSAFSPLDKPICGDNTLKQIVTDSVLLPHPRNHRVIPTNHFDAIQTLPLCKKTHTHVYVYACIYILYM
jgi:hypothetical protein